MNVGGGERFLIAIPFGVGGLMGICFGGVLFANWLNESKIIVPVTPTSAPSATRRPLPSPTQKPSPTPTPQSGNKCIVVQRGDTAIGINNQLGDPMGKYGAILFLNIAGPDADLPSSARLRPIKRLADLSKIDPGDVLCSPLSTSSRPPNQRVTVYDVHKNTFTKKMAGARLNRGRG